MPRASFPIRDLIRFGSAGVLGLILAAGAFANGAANVLAPRNPLQALRYDSGNGVALSGSATLLFQQAAEGQRESIDQGWALALRAMRQAPLSAASMRAVAIGTSLRGSQDLSARQFQIAQSLSRRDLATQVALIELCVSHDDVACALSHYDIALSTSEANAAPLFPTLSGALTSPDIARALAPYVRSGRPWIAGFMAYAAANADPAAAASVVIATKGLPDNDLNRESVAVILGRLGAAGQWEQARQIYEALHGRGSAAALGEFSTRTTNPQLAPVAWQVSNSGSLSAGFEPNGDRGQRLQIDISGGAGGEALVAHRVAFLPAGRDYVLTMQFEGPAMGVEGALGWDMLCWNGQQFAPAKQWRNAGSKVGRLGWAFAVPADCPVQQFRLLVKPDPGQPDARFSIASLQLAAAAQKEHQ